MSTLQGKSVLLTRATHQNTEFKAKLEAKGAQVILFPCLEIIYHDVPIPDTNYDWVIYTSRNAFEALKSQPVKAKQIATVGPSTVLLSPFEKGGPRGIFTPNKTFTSQELAKLFQNLAPQKILLPQGNLADPNLAQALTKQGHRVTALTVYSTLKPACSSQLPPPTDVITFLSPSAARNFLEITHTSPNDWHRSAIACIGSTTYTAVSELGFTQVIAPSTHTLDGLIECIEAHYS